MGSREWTVVLPEEHTDRGPPCWINVLLNRINYSSSHSSLERKVNLGKVTASAVHASARSVDFSRSLCAGKSCRGDYVCVYVCCVSVTFNRSRQDRHPVTSREGRK